jgi:hypothetical protein
MAGRLIFPLRQSRRAGAIFQSLNGVVTTVLKIKTGVAVQYGLCYFGQMLEYGAGLAN